MLRVLVTLAGLGLTIYAVVDCFQTEDKQVRYAPKVLWVVFIVIIPWVGPIVWLLAGRERSLPSGRSPTTGPKGPEDDPDFLRNL